MTVSVVIRPFKSGGQFYPAGTLVDPAGFKLYKSRLGSGNLAVVDEHNLKNVARFLEIRQKVENAEKLLSDALAESKVESKETESTDNSETSEPTDTAPDKPEVTDEYLAKVNALAEQLDVEVEGRPLEEVVAEIKEKAAQVKKEEE